MKLLGLGLLVLFVVSCVGGDIAQQRIDECRKAYNVERREVARVLDIHLTESEWMRSYIEGYKCKADLYHIEQDRQRWIEKNQP